MITRPNTGVPTYEEALEIERDMSVLDSELSSPSSLARRIMFTGDWFTVADLAALVGRTPSLIHQTMAVMKKIGFRFEKRSVGHGRGGPLEIRLQNPAYRPSKAALDAYRRNAPNGRVANKAKRTPRPVKDSSAAGDAFRAKERERKRRARVRAAAEERPAELPMLPTLGDSLQVAALACADDGSVLIALHGEKRAWTVVVVG